MTFSSNLLPRVHVAGTVRDDEEVIATMATQMSRQTFSPSSVRSIWFISSISQRKPNRDRGGKKTQPETENVVAFEAAELDRVLSHCCVHRINHCDSESHEKTTTLCAKRINNKHSAIGKKRKKTTNETSSTSAAAKSGKRRDSSNGSPAEQEICATTFEPFRTNNFDKNFSFSFLFCTSSFVFCVVTFCRTSAIGSVASIRIIFVLFSVATRDDFFCAFDWRFFVSISNASQGEKSILWLYQRQWVCTKESFSLARSSLSMFRTHWKTSSAKCNYFRPRREQWR